MITLRKKATRPPHMISGNGTTAMWTVERDDGTRHVYMRCPHCDSHHRVVSSLLKARFRWMRDAFRWARAARRGQR